MHPDFRHISDGADWASDGDDPNKSYDSLGQGLFWTGLVGIILSLAGMLLLVIALAPPDTGRPNPIGAALSNVFTTLGLLALGLVFLFFLILMIVGLTKWTRAQSESGEEGRRQRRRFRRHDENEL
jgi:hypothetical protein